MKSRGGREFDARLLRGRRAGLKTGRYNFGAIAQATRRGPIVPTGSRKSTARIGCATGMPGWRGGELLRLSHDVELRLRSSVRLFLPAECEVAGRGKPRPYKGDWICPARTASCLVVRAGAVSTDGGLCHCGKSWTWCRAGLLRLQSGRMWVRVPPG